MSHQTQMSAKMTLCMSLIGKRYATSLLRTYSMKLISFASAGTPIDLKKGGSSARVNN